MISDFLTSDLNMPVFVLSEEEWERAISEEKWLVSENRLNFLEKSATSIITPSKDSYFDNDSILEQFKRLFTLMKYSETFRRVDYRVDLLVDNATTHTKRHIDVNMFSKGINKSCPVDYLKWEENSVVKTVDCFYRRGDLEGKSKGLFYLCKELEIIGSDINFNQITLPKLRDLASKHPAFKLTSKLDIVVNDFNEKHNMNIKLHYVPKFHCELNPIEMYWANLKRTFRCENEQKTSEESVIKLIKDAREKYMSDDINNRIFSRFFRVCEAYNSGKSYETVMREYFNAKAEIKSKRRICLTK